MNFLKGIRYKRLLTIICKAKKIKATLIWSLLNFEAYLDEVGFEVNNVRGI